MMNVEETITPNLSNGTVWFHFHSMVSFLSETK